MNAYAKELQLKFDEIHALNPYEATEGLDTDDRVERICDEVLDYLIDAYRLGVKHVSEMLEEDIYEDLESMDDIIFAQIGGQTFEDRVRTHVENNDPTALDTLIDSEYHRVYTITSQWSAEQVEPSSPHEVWKTWCTQLDDRVRETHDFLESVSLPLREEFYTIDGDHALEPGGFEMAQNNVNCRCFLLYTKQKPGKA